ncbi:MAG TPA: extracellular solute-binding protein, partial [Pirellulaceae bacterium]|nr:extracellular solute-binding protein [Pirellulaceae bacterium]
MVFAILAAALLAGCPDSTDRANPALDVSIPVTLKVLVIEDRELGEAAQRRWQAEGLGELQMAYQSAAEFRQSEFSISADVDVLIYPERFQADLLHRQLLLEIPWETWNSEQVNKSDLLTHFRGSLMRQGDRYFALPLGGVNVVLMYRQDVLDALGTTPPTTWDELDQLLQRLTDADLPLDSNGQPLPRSIALPLAEEWAGHLLLARAAASVRSAGKLSALFQVETMEPLIHTPPFIEALDGLRRMARHQMSEDTLQSPRDVFAAMVQGRAALGIGWPTGGVEDLKSVQA